MMENWIVIGLIIAMIVLVLGGYVITFVHDAATEVSECVIIDAQDFEAPPVARIIIPRRVPFGFHSAWVPVTETS